MKNLKAFDAEVNIFDIYQICGSVIRFTDDLETSYNALRKGIDKFVNEAGVESLHKSISNFNRLMYVTTGKSVDPAISKPAAGAASFYIVARLKSATRRLALFVNYFCREVDEFIDRLYESGAFDNFSEDEADELSSLVCSLSLGFATFRSWVRKL